MTAATLAAALFVLALLTSPGRARRRTSWIEDQTKRAQAQLAQARLSISPRKFLVARLALPVLLTAFGLLMSPVLAGLGLVLGFVAPRLYLSHALHRAARRSEAEAPRFLQSLCANLSAGSTYLDALRACRSSIKDSWLREDLDFVIQSFLLDTPLEKGIAVVRGQVASRNLALIWDSLALCCASHVPSRLARQLLGELSATVQFNVQLADEVRARAAGIRLQIWLLALIVPAMYFYLRLLNPELLSFLDQTPVGRYVLTPLAVALEVLGIYLSRRLSEFQP